MIVNVFYITVDKSISDRLARKEAVMVVGGVTPIGVAQDMQKPAPFGYGSGIPQHVHVSVFDQNGNYLPLDESLHRTCRNCGAVVGQSQKL